MIINGAKHLTGLVASIAPVQSGSGDASPTNVRPISGWTAINAYVRGKNLLAPKTQTAQTDAPNGFTLTADNGVYTLNGTATNASLAYNFDFPIFLSPGTYSISYFNDAVTAPGLSVYLFNSGGSVIVNHSLNSANKTATFTITDTAVKCRIRGKVASLSNVKLSPMVVPGDTAPTTFVPYVSGGDYTVSIPSTPGTVYGGTIDVVKGILTVTHGIVTIDGTQTISANGLTENTSRALVTIPDKATGEYNIVSSAFATKIPISDTVGVMVGRAATNKVEFYLPATVQQTATALKAWFASNQTQLVFELATPQTFQLTPQQMNTLVGVNNIWADCGDVLSASYSSNVNLRSRRRALMGMQKATPTYFIDNLNPYDLTHTYNNNTNGFACQGGCVVDGVWYMVTIEQDSSVQYLYTLDLATNTFTLRGTYTELGHANDLTYNPNTQELIVAPMSGQKFIAIDISDYSISREIQTTGYSGHYAIAFDRKRNVIYSWSDGVIWVFDPNGNYLRTITLDTFVTHTTGQGMETDGEFIYRLWSKNPSYVDVYTMSGKFVKTQTITDSPEYEAIGYNWNGYFFMQAFVQSGKQRIYSLINRTFNGSCNLAYTPLVFGGKREQNGTITITGINSADFSSSGTKNYNTVIYGDGATFGYAYLNGKKLKISYDCERVSGQSGSVGCSIYTTTERKATTNRLYQKSFYHSVPESGKDHCEYEILIGTDYVPTSGKEGTYMGFWLFFYADSGNSCKVTNFRIDVEMPTN